LAKKPFPLRSTRALFFFEVLDAIRRDQAEPNGMKLGQFHYYPSSVRKRRRRLLSDEQLLVLAVGLTVGALGLWLILRGLN
jgi:hypothetical protein